VLDRAIGRTIVNQDDLEFGVELLPENGLEACVEEPKAIVIEDDDPRDGLRQVTSTGL